MRAQIGSNAPLMVDANQAWSLETAQRMARAFEPFDLGWLEEPMRVDAPLAAWKSLRDASRVPLAGGENFIGAEAFASAIESRALAVVQPDIAKWGGISGTWPVIAAIRAAGLRYCPHYLGAGIGLLASAHLLAAAGGDGMLEIDANANPLRTALAGKLDRVEAGRVDLGDAAGIGIDVDLKAIRALCIR